MTHLIFMGRNRTVTRSCGIGSIFLSVCFIMRYGNFSGMSQGIASPVSRKQERSGKEHEKRSLISIIIFINYGHMLINDALVRC